jgi:CTP synthase (UTP-ammonia lyase)
VKLRIGMVGDYRPDFGPHHITDDVLAHAAAASAIEIAPSWLETDRVTGQALHMFDALWIAPGSPYRSVDGALVAIRFARESGVPLGGACAGFLHVVLEHARNVLGFLDAVHEEYDPPEGSRLVLKRLACSVAGKMLRVKLAPGSLVARSYGCIEAVERYHCTFGLNPEYRQRLGNLVVSGWDDENEARVVELPGHPFFLATLFVPHSAPTSPHPVAAAFLRAALDRVAG